MKSKIILAKKEQVTRAGRKAGSAMRRNTGRVMFALVSLILQVWWLYGWLVAIRNYNAFMTAFSTVVSLTIVLRIYGKYNNSAFKMPWIIIILTAPVLGLSLYFLYGRNDLTRKKRRLYAEIDRELFPLMEQDPAVIEALESEDYALANQCRYTAVYGHYPVYCNTDLDYYPDGMEGLKAQVEALRKAEHFIFMEYHAIEDREGFGLLKEVLMERAAAGVEVRVIYDDFGSIGFLNRGFPKKMAAYGIQCRVFNPIYFTFNIFMNNRDHRKITVIDNKVGFVGGYNLANRYFHLEEVHGYWKDAGIRLEGDAVRNLSISFLEMWNAIKHTDSDYSPYLLPYDYQAAEQAFVQPYSDSPLDGEHVGENVYMNMIKNAKHYIWFTTPYLIITDEMSKELRLAAKRGVDVRIITPGVPDKKMIFEVTRSYYGHLVRDGVRIYEFTPGFCHAKQCVCDDEAAVIGTINLDYRSLYLHFENGCWIHGSHVVKEMREDFLKTFMQCEDVTLKYKTRSYALRIGQCILRLFAPLF